MTLFQNGFVVYHWSVPVMSSHLWCQSTYEVATRCRGHCNII